MEFLLTDSIADDILFAMENQNEESVFDSKRGCVYFLNSEDVPAGFKSLDEYLESEDVYSLPSWSSEEGFDLLEKFTEKLHAPLASQKLRRVLSGRRGVFRNFKNEIKKYPEVERQFHVFKNKEMRTKINQWYNELRESWGLERIAELEEDETQELVSSDFDFHNYDSLKDRESIACGVKIIGEEYKSQYPEHLGDFVKELFFRQSFVDDLDSKKGFVCTSQSGDFAGCILYSESLSCSKKTAALTDFFVLKNYRGFGIGKELLLKCIAFLKKSGIQFILVSNIIMPEYMEEFFLHIGFEKLGSGLMADLRE